MSADQGSTMAIADSAPTCMQSINRVSKLPVVESTIQTATDIYGKVKDYNSVTQWTLSTAESTVNKAVEVGKPIATDVVHKLEGPIKKVDDILCTGLDYVESKVPAVKLPPGEIILQVYTTTKDYVNITVTPVVESAYAYAEPAVKTAKDIVEPAVASAKHIVEPAVEKAKNIVEPAVEMAKNIAEPYVEKAQALKDYGIQKVEEYLHGEHEHEEGAMECDECQGVKQKMEAKNTENQ